MKVVHLMAGLGAASGVANIARRFARIQRERGDAVMMLAPAFKWNPIYFGLVFAIRAWWAARTADEVWVHCSWTFPVWFGAFLARLFEKKLVVVPEGSFDPKRLNNHAGWKKRLVAPCDRWVLRRADEVLALCRDEITWVKGFESSAKVRFEAVPIFLPTAWNEGKSKSEEVKNAEGRSLHALFLGRVGDPLKGVRFLEQAVGGIQSESGVEVEQRRVELFAGVEKNRRGLALRKRNKQTPPPKFSPLTEVVETVAKHQAAGFSPSTTANSVANPIGPHKGAMRDVGEAENRSRTVELRIVSDHFGAELEKDWDWCDVLVLPTLSENFGLVVAEALERGKRVITTDGAPAWDVEVEKIGGGGQWWDRIIYLKGYRDGTDEERVRLLKEAIATLV